ncbi:hypothetical protein BURPSPAST_J0727 [Burkholderia pseudomallei Pasteur 52237]|nr:hypothetical protein BURPSPAST_J0727 [Burkholderia pseudomallei Pasteur 52237]
MVSSRGEPAAAAGTARRPTPPSRAAAARPFESFPCVVRPSRNARCAAHGSATESCSSFSCKHPIPPPAT